MRLKIEGLVAGTLRARIKSEDPEMNVTELYINGEVNESDMKLIKQLSGKDGLLKTLDMSKATGLRLVNFHTFESGSSLSIVRLPKSLEVIGWGAFGACDKLTNVTIQNGVEKIDNYAFAGCAALKTITIPASVTSIGINSFDSCLKLEEIKVASTNKNYVSNEGVVYSKDGLTLIKYPAGKPETSFDIPNDVTKIGQNAFFMNDYLHTVKIPAGTVKIEDQAFSGCSGLLNLTIPVTVKEIGANVFQSCTSLLYIKMLSSEPAQIADSPENNKNMNIYVPLEAADTYRNAEGWKEYSNIYGK